MPSEAGGSARGSGAVRPAAPQAAEGSGGGRSGPRASATETGRRPRPAAPPSEARTCAHTVLRRVFEQGAYAEKALHAQARGLDARDRRLAMRLSYGAIQHAGTLDHFVERLADRGADSLDGAVSAALRVGLYELLMLDGSPDRAVVADTVEIVKRGGSRGHGLVNALMRRAARERDALLGGLSDATPQQAAIMHSHPLWLAEMWWRELGAERARALMAADNWPAETALRANTLVADAEQVAAHPELAGVDLARGAPLHGIELPEALVLGGPFDLLGSQLWRQGAAIAQSRAAMLVCRVLAPQPGERVLELCAAPGGKSTHIAALMAGEGEVVALERHPGRAQALARTAARMHAADIVSVLEGDACAPPVPAGSFARVLLDPPCSGLGTLQSRADLRWRADPARIVRLAELQRRMLAAAARCVQADGVLVYSTCTISAAENEQQIEAFLDSHPDFAVEPLCGSAGRLATLPDRDGTAGFFIARLRRSAAR